MRIGKKPSFGTAAALFGALLSLAVPAAAQTISNTASAAWTENNANHTVTSNTVDIAVTPDPITLTTYHPALSGTGTLPIQAPTCGGQAMAIYPGSESGSVTVGATPTNVIRVGETLLLRFSAATANRDSNAVDSLVATITTSRGDRETLRIFETGPDTGIFTAAIRTQRVPPTPQAGDCVLSIQADEQVTVAVSGSEGSLPIIAVDVGVLADPFGFVFDSEDGTPVSGAVVTMVEAATGAPAQIFGEDGVTPWPSRVVTGQAIVDGNGVSHPMDPGEFWFPRAGLGSYRLVVQPPTPYSAPSTAEASTLSGLMRPDGKPYAVVTGSFGETFSLTSEEAIPIDIPVDRPSAMVTITKTASRERVQPGDAIFYTITLTNPDPSRAKRGVTVVDTPSPWLRLRQDSVRVDGQKADGAVEITTDGRRLTLAVPTLAAGAVTRVTYAMTVRADAPPGMAVNRAVANDLRGGSATAEAAVQVERDTIAGRMTVIGRVTLGACGMTGDRPGIPGVRVMLEDGSFAITDRDGRYHFEGVVPGTHVVQVQRQTLPGEGHFVDCADSTRSAGNAESRFIIGQGGSLAVADFMAVVPNWQPVVETAKADEATSAPLTSAANSAEAKLADAPETDWMAAGDGPAAFLYPTAETNPRIPSTQVAIRHKVGQTVELSLNGKPVDLVAFEGAKTAPGASFAVSVWRGVPLAEDMSHLTAIVRNADGSEAARLTQDVAFVSIAWRAEIVPEKSHLVADGKTRPVVAIRITDRRGRPVRSGVSGGIGISDPYQSATLLEQLQIGQLTGANGGSATWQIDGDNGIALVELAPTMISGPLRLDFKFADRDLKREQQLDTWVVPGDLDWTIVGLAEGSVGERTVADNMERTGRFDSDLGKNARVAFYAKGRVLGRFLMTMAYDSAKDRDDQRLFGTIDPNAYYTVFADGSDRRYDAASREKLYVRVETATFYALYGDIVTGFDQTVLARYQRSMTGVKAEGQFGGFHAQAFAADVASRYRHDEIQGNGLSGPYRLRDRNVIFNSEKIAIEVRDRFRSEIVVERRELTRFLDYDLDILSGTIMFKEPVLSRDFNLNPQFIVIDYEVDEGRGEKVWNGGARADFTTHDGALRIGASAISDRGDTSRTDLGAVDLRARFGAATEVRGEFGVSRKDGTNSKGWLVEAEHRTGSLDLLAYARSLDADYGTGQQTGSELGRRKFGVDASYSITDRLTAAANVWNDNSLSDASSRTAVQANLGYRSAETDAQVGISHFADTLADGRKESSTVLEGAVTQRLLNNKLELGVSSSVALGHADSIDLPARHRFRARYALTDWLRLLGNYEIADGRTIRARTFNSGFELSPWQGGRVVTTLGREDIGEFGKRSFAAFGLSQSVPITKNLMMDATLDGNRKLGGATVANLVNPDYPAASGGHISQDGGGDFEDFTAATLGLAWRKDRWSATSRAEYRDGQVSNRMGFTLGVIREMGEGVVVGSGGTFTRAWANGGARSEIIDTSIAAAFRPTRSEFAFLAKVQFRSDSVRNAVAGEAGGAGRTALTVTGDARAQRLIASLSTNWSPRGIDNDKMVQRTEIGLFVGGRYNFDRIEDYDLSSTALITGLDARIGLGERFEIGGTATVRTTSDGTTSFSLGPQVGFSPAKNTLMTIGYNITGFRDRDFSATRNTDKGVYAAVRLKFDANTFAFLGLNR